MMTDCMTDDYMNDDWWLMTDDWWLMTDCMTDDYMNDDWRIGGFEEVLVHNVHMGKI